ncbi:MAG: hypothetical protein WCJ81_07610 [bacterium]
MSVTTTAVIIPTNGPTYGAKLVIHARSAIDPIFGICIWNIQEIRTQDNPTKIPT